MPSDSVKTEKRIFTVTEITQDIKLLLESSFGEVWVEGEVSNFRPAASGHLYFSLKDDKAVLGAAMFAYAAKAMPFKLEDGQHVICFGRINVYEPRGQYQIIIEKIEPKGIGAQQLALEQLKKKLSGEGLFDAAHKRELPLMPFCVGIVTSTKGAAVRDILQVLKKGAGFVDAVIAGARVQGEGAALEIAQGIQDLNLYKKVDLIIVSRGGGSVEDLWAFNEEVVARAIYNSRIPVISAVGHQINTTISDMVADVFVETPTAAAKLIVDKKNNLVAEIDSLRQDLKFSIQEIVNSLKEGLVALAHSLKSPRDRLLEKQQLLDDLRLDIKEAVLRYLSLTGERANFLIEKLEALSPLKILSRGYSLTTMLTDGTVIKDAGTLKIGDKIQTTLAKGSFISSVEEVGKR
jgi:exodeoxyribonuclease VII large subunit